MTKPTKHKSTTRKEWVVQFQHGGRWMSYDEYAFTTEEGARMRLKELQGYKFRIIERTIMERVVQ